MIKNIKLESPFFQYFTGLFINLVIILILTSSKVSYHNLQVPENNLQSNIWTNDDPYYYVILAKNYLGNGVVGEGGVPTAARTVGYPLYLAIMITIFGNNWQFKLFFLQAIIFAFIYPVFTTIIKLIFSDNRQLVIWSFLFMLLSGMYTTWTTVLMPDMLFTLILSCGICFAILAIKHQSWIYLAVHVILIGLSAQLKPILFLYFFPEVLILVALAKKYGVMKLKKIRLIILSSTLLIFILCNLPTLRNYINYGILSPSTVMENNLFYSHTTRILSKDNNSKTIDSLYSRMDTIQVLRDKLHSEIQYFIKTIFQHPCIAIEIFVENIFKTMFNNYYYNFSHYWGSNIGSVRFDFHKDLLKKMDLIFYVSVIFSFIYLVIYIMFIYFCVRLIKNSKYLFLFTILIFMLYFLVPSGFVWGALRFRLPIEGFIIIFSLYQLQQLLIGKRWLKSLVINRRG
jgi:hypothetical protein